MNKIIASFLLGLFSIMLISSCSQKSIHTSKDRPESYAEFVQEN